MTNKNNKITLDSLKQDSGKFFKKKQVTVKSLSGKSYVFELADNIKETDVDEVIKKMSEVIRYCSINGIEAKLLPLQYMALIKLYTNLPFMRDVEIEKMIEDDLELIQEMINMGLYSELINKIGEERCNKFEQMLYSRENAMKELNDEQVTNWVLSDKIVISGDRNE
ncbi:MAG: hypothetical protein ACRC1P_11050 [Cellulosilyticaceae bacterium]